MVLCVGAMSVNKKVDNERHIRWNKVSPRGVSKMDDEIIPYRCPYEDAMASVDHPIQ